MDTVCIQVAAADSLYVTDDYLVTHNTLNDSFIILDEAQNTSPEQMKMFLTRLGFNSKMVVTGDITQIDLPREHDSGLVVVDEILEDVEGIEFVRFGEEDVVRHKLVRRIVAAYTEHAQRSAPELRPREARVTPPRIEVIGVDSGRTTASPRTRSSGCACSRWPPPGSRTGTSRSSSSTRRGSASSTRVSRHRPADRRALVPGRRGRRRRRPARVGDVVICPAHAADLREAVVHGVLHLTGMDHETDDGEMLALQAELSVRW